MKPCLLRCLNILGMEYLSPPKTYQILWALGGKVQNALIEIFDSPIWSRIPCECGNAIDEQAKPLFTRTQGLLGMLRRVEVQRIVHCKRHLVSNKREKADFFSAIGIGFGAAYRKAPEAPVHCRQ